MKIEFDVAGSLANLLTGYEATAILREQVQNADDACVKQNVEGTLGVQFTDDALTFQNESVLTDEDWDRLMTPSSRGKFREADQTGEFGIGFWSVLHLTDAPVVLSGHVSRVLDPFVDEIEGTQLAEPLNHTLVELPLRRQQTRAANELDVEIVTAEVLDRLERKWIAQLDGLLLFIRRLHTIRIRRRNGTVIVARRISQPEAGEVERVCIEITGQSPSHYTLVRGRIPDPFLGRNPNVSVAFALDGSAPTDGVIFCTFPTETSSGLNFAVNGHFFAADNRRAIANSGDHGAWNDRIFEFAGELIGRNLEQLIESGSPDDLYHRLNWFVPEHIHSDQWNLRGRACLDAVDEHARAIELLPDRTGRRRLGKELVLLPGEIAEILVDHVDGAADGPPSDDLVGVFHRWGVQQWTAVEVSEWLGEKSPGKPIPRRKAPPYLADADSLHALLKFCVRRAHVLDGVTLALATDDMIYPLASSALPRPHTDIEQFVHGLRRPLVDPRFQDTMAWSRAPSANAEWLADALRDIKGDVVGKKFPLKSFGALSSVHMLGEVVDFLCRTGTDLTKVPLAVDGEDRIGVFDSRTVAGLPEGPGRKPVDALLRLLNHRPVRQSLDTPDLAAHVTRLDADGLVDLLNGMQGWKPTEHTALLLAALRAMNDKERMGADTLDRLRRLRIWPVMSGEVRTLAEVRLPPKGQAPPDAEDVLVHPAVAVDPEYGTAAMQMLRDVFGVDEFDFVEELVQECENPPSDRGELIRLLAEIAADRRKLSPKQKERLAKSDFVPCVDGRRRRPAEVVLMRALPRVIGSAQVIEEARDDPGVEQLLRDLGAQELPTELAIVDGAHATAEKRVARNEIARDPGVALWRFLSQKQSDYHDDLFEQIREIPWLASDPGLRRRKPSELADPQFRWAQLEFPIPIGVETPSGPFRDRLGLKAQLSAEDCIRFLRASAQHRDEPSQACFNYLEQLAKDERNRATLADLRDVAFFPTSEGLCRPDDLVSGAKAEVWSHLRRRLDSETASHYPSLFAALGVSAGDDELHPAEHEAVLQALAEKGELDDRDRQLALLRMRSLAEAYADDSNEQRWLSSKPCVLTARGVVTPNAAFTRDLPNHIIEQLEEVLPIISADVGADTRMFFEDVGLRSLRGEICLEAETSGRRTDERWQGALAVHSRSIRRFLWHHLDRVPDDMANWPPVVRGVDSILVNATRDGVTVATWVADAHLMSENGTLVLSIRSRDVSIRHVVDALTTHFGTSPERKGDLYQVLDLGPDEAQRTLDWLEYRDLPREHMVEAETVTAAIEDEPDEATAVQPFDEPAVPDEPTPGEFRPIDDEQEPESEDLDDHQVGEDLPERLTPHRVPVDWLGLEGRGFEYEDVYDDVLEDDPADDPKKSGAPSKVVLSFYDVQHGLIPLARQHARELAQGVDVDSVCMFGETHPARQPDAKHVSIEGGADLFAEREILPGTIVYCDPGMSGTIELSVREVDQEIADVWVLEVDEETGKLDRHRVESVRVRWETDGPIYRCERRWEDIEALRREATASALDLVIEAFENFGTEGLTEDEVWDAVALYRLFARSTIRTILSQQKGLFELGEDGRWYMSGTKILRKRGPSGAGPATPSKAKSVLEEAHVLARRLHGLLTQIDTDAAREVLQVLGVPVLAGLPEREFEQACRSYLRSGTPELLVRLEEDIDETPSLAHVATYVLENQPVELTPPTRSLAELLRRTGRSDVVARAEAVLARDDVSAHEAESDSLSLAERMRQDGITGDALQAAIETALHSPPSAAYDEPVTTLDTLRRTDDLVRHLRRAVPDYTKIDAAWGEYLGALDSQVGDTDAHNRPERQELLLTIRLLQGRRPEDLVDLLSEYAKLLGRIRDRAQDAAHAYRLLVVYAEGKRVENAVVRRARQLAEEPCGGVAKDDSEADFCTAWAQRAGVQL